MKYVKLFEQYVEEGKKPILGMDNVNTVPEGNHVITKEDIDKIVKHFNETDEENEGDAFKDYALEGITLKKAADLIANEKGHSPGFEDEYLQHLIMAVFPNKYTPWY